MSFLNWLNPVPPIDTIADDFGQIGSDVGSIITGPAKVIQSVGDFLSFVAWIFDPINILRAVEFVTGMFLIFYGIKIIGTGSGQIPGAAEAVKATPPGRVLGELGARRQGARGARRKIRNTELEAQRRRGASQAMGKYRGSKRMDRQKAKNTAATRSERFGYKEAKAQVERETQARKASANKR